MELTNYTLIFLVFAFAIIAFCFFFGRRTWSGIIIMAAFLVRAALAVWLEGGLKYAFVVDSLRYEYRSWLLSQTWISSDIFHSLTYGSVEKFNLYEAYLAFMFKMFGKEPLIATLTNAMFGTLAIFLVYRIQIEFLSKGLKGEPKQFPACIAAFILAAYPSFNMWSATNIRDPLYLLACIGFFYSFFVVVSRPKAVNIIKRVICIGTGAFSFWLVLGLREYINNLFVGAIVASCVFYLFFRKFHPVLLVPCLLLLVIGTLFGVQSLFPQFVQDNLNQLENMRESFANLRLLDNVAKSSYALDQSFLSIVDVIKFVPISLSHYFFGPFPWEIADTVQAVSFVETIAVYILTYPTLVGIKRIYQRAPFQTVVILTFVAFFVAAQSIVISNMGTIFRHRTLPFLFLAIFAGEGCYAVWKEDMPAILTTEYWRSLRSRRESVGRS